LYEKLDALRQPQRLGQFLLVCEADKRGRLGMNNDDYPQAAYLRKLFQAAVQPRAQPLLDAGLRGPDVGKALRKARLRAIGDAISEFKKNPAP